MRSRHVLMVAALLIWAPRVPAATILDVTFGNLTAGTTINDAQSIQDTSGNNYSGFWGGGAGANNTPVITTPTGNGLNSVTTNGQVILRPNLTTPWGTTPSTYFQLDAGTSYTFEAMLNWQNTGNATNGIMGQIGTTEWWIRESSGSLVYVFDDGPNRVTSPSISISSATTDTDWHHLAVVFDRSSNEIRSYLDYQLINTDTNATITSLGTIGTTGDRYLGAYNTTSSNFFDGWQSRYRISDEALAPGQFFPVPEPSLGPLALAGLAALGYGWRCRRQSA